LTIWARFLGWRWWIRVLVVFVASRIVTTTILALSQLAAEGRVDLVAFTNLWDAGWYHRIITEGYPAVLPIDGPGLVGQNAWAFMPAYPYLVHSIEIVTRIPWEVVAPILSTVLALGASLAFFVLMRRSMDEGQALFATTLFLVFPTSTMLQVAYPESLQLLLLFVLLLLVLDRRYLLAVPVIILMSLTRPSGIAVALFLLVHLIIRLVRRRQEPFPWNQRIRLVIAGIVSGAAGLLWLGIAGWATGIPNAYVETENVWRRIYTGVRPLEPFLSWIVAGRFYFGQLGATRIFAIGLALLAVVFLVSLLAVLLLGPWRRHLGLDLRVWVASWAIYLLAVFFPQSSTFRLLMPMAPALGMIAAPRSRIYRVALVVLAIGAQVVWVQWFWVRLPMDITPP
jgi:hypothetical protein